MKKLLFNQSRSDLLVAFFSFKSTSLLLLGVKQAFSLTEVTLALGIISFALLSIVGLFPIGLRSVQESHRETRATLIAQQIFNDLQSQPGINTFIAKGANITLANQRIPLSLTTNSTNTISYNVEGFPIDEGNVASAVYLAQIEISANTPIPSLSRVQTTIETPASAPATNRSRCTFVTLMDQQ